MKAKHQVLPAVVIAFGLTVSGCSRDTSRSRTVEQPKTADHTGSMAGSGGTKGSGDLGTGRGGMDLDRRNRTGTDTGMSSKSGTTGGGTSVNGTERENDPHRRDR